ncbi:unnamed protein product [Peniophora sp. CBMAI 1063]|nr:unnamed protein product [Peniophora sp. CBMAI 1063]
MFDSARAPRVNSGTPEPAIDQNLEAQIKALQRVSALPASTPPRDVAAASSAIPTSPPRPISPSLESNTASTELQLGDGARGAGDTFEEMVDRPPSLVDKAVPARTSEALGLPELPESDKFVAATGVTTRPKRKRGQGPDKEVSEGKEGESEGVGNGAEKAKTKKHAGGKDKAGGDKKKKK